MRIFSHTLNLLAAAKVVNRHTAYMDSFDDSLTKCMPKGEASYPHQGEHWCGSTARQTWTSVSLRATPWTCQESFACNGSTTCDSRLRFSGGSHLFCSVVEHQDPIQMLAGIGRYEFSIALI